MDEQNMGNKTNDVTVNNLRYADDTFIIARTHEHLQTLINRIVTVRKAKLCY